MEDAFGYGGGVMAGYAEAATFSEWSIDAVGPSLFKFRAVVQHHRPALLAFVPLNVWILRGPLRWTWTLDAAHSVINGQFEAIVGQPSIGPAAGG